MENSDIIDGSSRGEAQWFSVLAAKITSSRRVHADIAGGRCSAASGYSPEMTLPGACILLMASGCQKMERLEALHSLALNCVPKNLHEMVYFDEKVGVDSCKWLVLYLVRPFYPVICYGGSKALFPRRPYDSDTRVFRAEPSHHDLPHDIYQSHRWNASSFCYVEISRYLSFRTIKSPFHTR